MSKHTPLPWTRDGYQLVQDDMQVARCCGDNAVANAALIARAVNTHQTLILALKAIIRDTDHVAMDDREVCNSVRARAVAALKLVEKG